MDSAQFNQRLLLAAGAIRIAEDDYRKAIAMSAEAERRYKRREALAMLQIEEYRNQVDRAAQAEVLKWEDGNTLGDVRYEAHLAHGLMDAAKLALKNRTQELSALQSEAALSKAEADYYRTAPHEAVGP